jgi:hypothetical protein
MARINVDSSEILCQGQNKLNLFNNFSVRQVIILLIYILTGVVNEKHYKWD